MKKVFICIFLSLWLLCGILNMWWTDRTLDYWLSFIKGCDVDVPFFISAIISIVCGYVMIIINIVSELIRIIL